ncbi:hypothetical protein N2152v2_004151 [Parachlorella kessleri]
MRTTVILAAVLLLLAAVVPTLGIDPFADTKSKQEAVAAFADVEQSLVKKDAKGLRGLYESWKKTYGIVYPKAEDAQRYANFVATVRGIIANNKDTRTTHWSGLNAYSALSDKEFRARFTTSLKRHDTPVKASRPARRSLLQTLPAYKNWVAEGKVTSVKNQGGCGSCWAFAGVAATESRVLIALGKTNATYSLDGAEQQVVDCARAPSFPYSFGCGGGQIEDPFRFAAKGFLAPESLYAYTGKTGTCKSVNSTAARVVLSGTGFKELDINSATLFKQALQTSPFTIAFYASDPTFKSYKGGVYNPTKCGNPWLVDHAVLLVGYNNTESSWYIKNSWGATWGEKGYFRMFMKPDGTQGTCQMYTVSPAGLHLLGSCLLLYLKHGTPPAACGFPAACE